ncbi:NifB/NifX family molybdenum-iron cluster-binding protein [candidate division KSB1 bacterium]
MNNTEKIAIPTVGDNLTAHFGHCEYFTIIEAEKNKIIDTYTVTPPMHQPGVYPRFLAEQGVNIVITGGMGQRAQELFTQNNIQVILGINPGNPAEIAQQYLNKQLESGKNLCDH